jgi:ACS family tartrate transporter-like MFS transporter
MFGSFLAIGLSSTAMIVILGYLAFAAICHAIPMLLSSAWADVLCARELAVGAAAINTMSQIGAFAMPYAWGAAKDATGSFHAGLMALSAATAMLAALILYVRARIAAGRRARTLALAT